MIFSTKQLKALNDFNLSERQAILALAHQKLSVPEKLILNIIKLILLIPPFIFLARQEWLLLLATSFISVLAYFLIMKPISLTFGQKYLHDAIKKHRNSN